MEKKTNEYIAGDIERLICLLILLTSAYFLYGIRALTIAAIALAVALVCDMMMRIARANCYTERDLSSYVIALTIVLMFPASVSYVAVITSVVVAVMVGKYAFGGLHHYPFNPAAVGFTVALVSWPEKLVTYPVPFTDLPMSIPQDMFLVRSHAFTLKNGGLPSTSLLNIATGNFAGPMGATFILVLVAAAIMLCLRKRISFSILLTFLLTSSALILLFPRVSDANPLEVLQYELSSGVMLFAMVFIVPDRICTPSRLKGKIIYGVVLGIVSMLFSYYGAFEIGICFAVIIVSALSGFFDKFSNIKLVKRWLRRRKEAVIGK